MSKSIQLFFIFLIAPFLLFYHYCKQVKRKLLPHSSSSSSPLGSESGSGRKMDQLRRYVLCLEDDNELPERMLKNICDVADHLIQIGKTHQPHKLSALLTKSTGFTGVVEFDNGQVPSFDSFEPPNSWMMAVVTLTSIVVALPNIPNRMVERLLSSVSEGLIYVRLVEKELDGKEDMVKIKNAAELIWFGVELYGKWLDHDFRKMASKEVNSKGTLQSLSDIAENSVMEFKGKVNESQKKNPLEWPVKIIAANSMYRITQALLLDYELNNERTDEELFEKLSIIISDILAACLTNLPSVITTKCFSSVAEKREESVQQAAHLLGEIEEILEILQHRERPSMSLDQAVYIDEWRAIIKQEHIVGFISSSDYDTVSSSSCEIHIVVEQEAS